MLDGVAERWYVHIVNDKDEQMDGYKYLLVLDEISRDDSLTQRDLSKRLGIALGLINSYMKNLASKGYITVSQIPRKRYKYYLTPKGFQEKTRLTYAHLRNFTNLYRVARKDFRLLFQAVGRDNVRRIVFCGVDEVTEIAYLSLQEAALELIGVVDDRSEGSTFFDHEVMPLSGTMMFEPEVVVITSFQRGEELMRALCDAGVDKGMICDISGGGWLKRIRERGDGFA